MATEDVLKLRKMNEGKSGEGHTYSTTIYSTLPLRLVQWKAVTVTPSEI